MARHTTTGLVILALVAGWAAATAYHAAPAPPSAARASAPGDKPFTPAGPAGFPPPPPARAGNLAVTEPAPTIPPPITRQSRKMARWVYRVSPSVSLAVGFGLANSAMIVGPDGLVIIDTTETAEVGRAILAEFRKISDKPVRAVIYTHHHPDHLGGARAFVTESDLKDGTVEVIAHKDLTRNLAESAGPLLPIRTARALYMYGKYLEPGPLGFVNNGIGPVLDLGTTALVPPTRTVEERLDVTLAGVPLEILHVPSETRDEIAVWMPSEKVLFSAEVLQGESFPNLYTIRGEPGRDPLTWVRSLDRLRRLPAEHLVPSHGRPLSGREAVADTLTAYRDAIQFVHDQTVRLMNRGLTPDEIAARLTQLPPHLRDHPWLGELYGTVRQASRQIYDHYLGWFQGDPTALDPLPPVPRSTRYVEAMGGRDRVLAEARAALDRHDPRWAAEVLTHVIRANPADAEARQVKAAALRELGLAATNVTWRNWYLTAALELEGRAPFRLDALNPAGTLAGLSGAAVFQMLPVRLVPERCRDGRAVMGVELTDTREAFALEVRRGVAEFRPHTVERPDFRLVTEKATVDRILLGRTTLLKAVEEKKLRVEGNLLTAVRFLSYFETPTPLEDIRFTAR